VLYSAEAAPLSALLDIDDLKLVHPPATALFKTIDDEGSDNDKPQSDAHIDAVKNDQVKEIVFVVAGDKVVNDLIVQLRNELASNASVELVVINNDQNILQAFADQAEFYGELDAVHIISHAADGELRFGQQTINEASLHTEKAHLERLGAALNIDADILLYGCNLSSTDVGHEFARTLSSLTSADVASSNNITGHKGAGGDWDLEVVEGEVETQVVASQSIQQNWLGSLNIDLGLIHHFLLNGDGVDHIAGDDLVFYNGVTFVPGPENLAADFTGDHNAMEPRYGEIPGWGAPQFGTHDFTIALRVNVDPFMFSETIVSTTGGTSTDHGLTLRTDLAGRVEFIVSDGLTQYSVTSATAIDDGEWYHITAERTNNALQLTVQKESAGLSDLNGNGNGAGSVNLDNANPLRFGAESPSSGTTDFTGLIDDIRIYSRALDTQETSDLEIAGLGTGEQVLVNNELVSMPVNSSYAITDEKLKTTDVDTPADQIKYTIVADGVDVHFTLSGVTLGNGDWFTQADIDSGLVGIVHSSSGVPVNESIGFSVDDGHGTATTADFTVNLILPPNNAPVAGDGALAAVDEDSFFMAGERISDIIGFTDADLADTFAGILVVFNPNDPLEGNWEYSADGNSWMPIQAVSETNALALSSSTYIRFTPETNFNGTVTELRYRVLDSRYTIPEYSDFPFRKYADASVNGADTSISANIGKLGTSITPVNDAPIVSTTSLTAIDEDTTAPLPDRISDLLEPSFVDPDAGAALTGIAITSNDATTEGEWAYSSDGITWHYVSTVTMTGALAVSADYYIQFLPAADYNGIPPGLEFRAVDDTYAGPYTIGTNKAYINLSSYGIDGPVQIASQPSLQISVLPSNDAPVAVDDNISVLEGGVVTKDLRLNDSDIDGDVLSVLIISGGTHGSVTVNSDKTINYQHNGSENFTDSFTYVVNDGTISSAQATVTVNITPVNEAPTIGGVNVYNLNESDGAGTVVAEIIAADPEGGALDVNISGADASYFTVNTANQIILVQPIDHESLQSSTVSFDVTVSDSLGLTSNSQKVNVAVADVNEAPTIVSASLAGVPENSANPSGKTVLDLFDNATNDVDKGDKLSGVAIALNPADSTVEGKWQYSVDQNNWVDIGVVSSTNALVLNFATAIRFLPAADFHGPVPALKVHALDLAYSGFSDASTLVHIDVTTATQFGSISVDSAELLTAVSPINDRPTIGNAYLPDIDEDNTTAPGETVQNLFTSTFLDADTTDTFSGIVISGDTSTAAQGYWAYSIDGTSWNPIGSVSLTSALVLEPNAFLKFVPKPDYNGQVGELTIHGLDSSYTGAFSSSFSTPEYMDVSNLPADSAVSSNTGKLDTAILPVNDPPLVVVVSPPLNVDENASDNTVVGSVVAQDIDDVTGFTYALVSDAGGLFDINSATGVITVQPGAVLNHELSPIHPITVAVTDQGGEVGLAQVSILVNDINDAPEILDETPLADINEGVLSPAGATIDVIFGGYFNDEDAGQFFHAIAIVRNDTNPAQGTWQYSYNNAPWYSVSSVSDTNALILPTSNLSKLRFVPSGDYNGPAPVLEAYVLDSTYNSGVVFPPFYHSDIVTAAGSGISDTAYQVTHNVLPVNDAPHNVTATPPLTIAEDASAGDVVGTASGHDVDDTVFTFTLTGTAGGRFEIDANTGVVRLASGAATCCRRYRVSSRQYSI